MDIKSVIDLDKNLFYAINSRWTLPFLDKIYPWWREGVAWTPLYIFILSYLFITNGKKTWAWFLFVLVNVFITDQVSSNLIKHSIMRLRPCSDPEMIGKVRLLLDHCSGGFSFTSSHATNHFGFATYGYITLKDIFKGYSFLFFLWAATIAYGQVYVGVHYPLDILVGSFIGVLIGSFSAKVYLGQPKINKIHAGLSTQKP